MPVKLSPRLLAKPEARIEIIPLIDIMFFLLAAFMLVSLSMVNLKTLPVNLPTAAASTAESKQNLLSITVDKGGLVYLDRKPVGIHELAQMLQSMQAEREDLRVLISGDKAARHGDVIHVLDTVRSSGIQNVAFEIRSTE